MDTQISKEVKQEVKKLLPLLRVEVLKEFAHWNLYHDNDQFNSDEKVLEILPYSAYEYILLAWGIEPDRVTMPAVVDALNNKLFADLRHITCHALRHLALKQGSSKKK